MSRIQNVPYRRAYLQTWFPTGDAVWKSVEPFEGGAWLKESLDMAILLSSWWWRPREPWALATTPSTTVWATSVKVHFRINPSSEIKEFYFLSYLVTSIKK